MKTVPHALDVIREAEDKFGAINTPFCSVLQIYLLTLKVGKVNSKLVWLFNSILDGVRNTYVFKEDISVRKLNDKQNINSVDIILYKQLLLAELLGPVMNSFNFTPLVQQKFRNMFQDHAIVRQQFGNRAGEKGSERQFLSGLDKAQALFVSLVEGAIYNKLHDTTIKQCIKQVKQACDAVSYSTLDAAITQIHEEEGKKEAAQTAATQD